MIKKIFIFGLFIILSITIFGEKSKHHKNPEKSGYIGKIFFISTNNFGCQCMMKRSRQMESSLSQLQKEHGKIKKHIEVENILFSKNQDIAMNILKQCEVDIPPAIILMDNKNKVLFKVSHEYEAKHIQILKKKIEALIEREKT